MCHPKLLTEIEMLFQVKRTLVAIVFALMWIGWAVWANLPHQYDFQALRAELAVSMPQATLEPASAGFPFGYMRYEYPPNGKLLVLGSEPSAVLPNILFCLTGILSVTLLVFRIRRVSTAGVVVFCLLAFPGLVFYVLLNGPHPDVISYLYLTPPVLLLFTLCYEAFRKQRGRTKKPNEVPVASPAC